MEDLERMMQEELDTEDGRVYGMLAPFLGRGGKRIRPAVCFLSCGAVGGDYPDALEPSAIIELFHNFTLIHDDIEDDSRFRRGEPALHIAYGMPIALNSGDALYTLLWKRLVSLDMKPARLIALQKMYAESFKRVVDGQGVELSWIRNGRFDVTEDEYLEMIGGKTSALIGLSCEVGSFMGGGNKRAISSLREYGECIGTAFQVQDDVLNVSGEFEKYQKEIGGDITEGKRTLMVVHSLKNADGGSRERLISILSSHSKEQEDISEAISILRSTGSIEYARRMAVQKIDEAKRLLDVLEDSTDRKALISLADYVVSRER